MSNESERMGERFGERKGQGIRGNACIFLARHINGAGIHEYVTDLHAGACEHAEEHGELSGRAEHVGVHQLPAALLPLLRLLFVSGQLQ
jgi:hypothetical protein